MYNEYINILVLLGLAVALPVAFVVLSSVLGRPKKSATDLMPYECGVDQATEPRRPFSVKFFIVALLFLIFDAEVALLYPWAAYFRKFSANGMGSFAILEGVIFIGVLAVGLIYVIRTRALEWR